MTTATTRRSERIPWDDRLATVHRQYPSTDQRDWSEALRDYDLMGALIRDILKVESAPKRRGQRPSLDIEAGEARLRQLWGDEWTTLPFAEAFRLLSGSLSRRAVGERVGVPRATVQRLLDGLEPTGQEMERIAAAFGKPPTYFREYRVGLVCGFLVEYFADAPEASVALAHRLSRR